MVQICRGKKNKASITAFPGPALKAWKNYIKDNYKKEKENASAGDWTPKHEFRRPMP